MKMESEKNDVEFRMKIKSTANERKKNNNQTIALIHEY